MPFDDSEFWLTPPELLNQLNNEFHFDNDPCPYPKPENYDGLIDDWGQSSYVNPPFKGPTAWVKKCILESEKGKQVVFVFPVDKWILMLLTHPNLKEVRNLKDVKWCSTKDGRPGKGIGRHIAMFVLEGKK